jgi:glutamyl/glutaminyl-tRNA synthetase
VITAPILLNHARLACTGNPNGPSLYHLLEVLGKEKVLQRIESILK